VITSVLSMVMARRVGHLLDELTTKYIPAYGNLARMNVHSLERALALRWMVIAKMQTPPDEAGYAERFRIFEAKGLEVEQEAAAARKLIIAIIEDVTTPSDNAALARIESRIDTATSDIRRHLNDETAQMLPLLDARDFVEARRALARVDTLRDEFDQKIDTIRADMLAQVHASAATVMRNQRGDGQSGRKRGPQAIIGQTQGLTSQTQALRLRSCRDVSAFPLHGASVECAKKTGRGVGDGFEGRCTSLARRSGGRLRHIGSGPNQRTSSLSICSAI